MNSCQKGKRGEREFAAYLRDNGIGARRGQQFSGGEDSPDVISELNEVHWEVKRTERLALYDAVDQAIRDAGGKLPIVAHKANRGEWVAVVPMAKLIPLLKEKFLGVA